MENPPAVPVSVRSCHKRPESAPEKVCCRLRASVSPTPREICSCSALPVIDTRDDWAFIEARTRSLS